MFNKITKLFNKRTSIINENSSLRFKIHELESMIENLVSSRRKDFDEIKGYFNTIIDEKVEEIREAMQIVIDKKQDEIKRLNKIIDDNHEIVQNIKTKNIEVNQLGDESTQRLKLASDFFNKGVQQMERIFSEFATHKRTFKDLEDKSIPKLKHGSGGRGLIES